MILRAIFMCLLFPASAFAADEGEPNTLLFYVIAMGALALYGFIKEPDWFRNWHKKVVKKHDKYVGWTRGQSEQAQNLSDDAVWVIIERAVKLKMQVQTALLLLLFACIESLYPIYAERILGPSPPYGNEMLLGVAGGAVFGSIILLSGRITLRIRIRSRVAAHEHQTR